MVRLARAADLPPAEMELSAPITGGFMSERGVVVAPVERLNVADLSMRQKVVAIESVMRTMPDQLDLPVSHHFSQGVYARELHIPAGTTLVGKIHKYQQLNILLKGRLSVLVGDEVKMVEAGFVVVSPPGTKRIAYAHEDSVWLTVHGTDETDLDKIESHFIAQSETEYLEFCEQQKLLSSENIKCLG